MERKPETRTPDVGDKTKSFHKGQVIYKEGQSSNEAYIIKQGSVGVYRLSGNKRITLGIMRPGQIFGEMGVISEEKRTASAEALEYTEVIVLDQNLLHTLLLKCPRPVQIITTYLVERIRALNARVTERSCSNTFSAVCNIIQLAWKGLPRPSAAPGAKPGAKGEAAQLSTVELSRTIKDILLISQVEIDDILEKLAKLHVVEITDVKGSRYRQDPLLGTRKKTGEFVRERLLSVPDLERFANVTRNLAKDNQDDTACELEFIDLDDFAALVQAQPETILKKISYGEMPPTSFFFHKRSITDYAEQVGGEFFQRAKRPRLKTEDLATVQDIVAVDNATLGEALSKLGFYKVSVLASLAGPEARQKIMANLSKKIAAVVTEEVGRLGAVDPDEASDIEDELLALIKTMKGLNG
ncbi:cyclic nucleotide-binding domain-containing protein [Fundidesulfovibrio agrisoli]|uniref:cyclic nucleotide-binding domain-containing protein n=1 Tax=Fundidesulfovibrio agrisoli TaxID=2922717 RepID=UPI001FABCC5C